MYKLQLVRVLEELGLSDPEARIYLAALALGPASILKLARAAGVKRTTVYSLIERLKQAGLMSVEIRGFKQRFVASDPERLEVMIEQRRQRLQAVLPELSALHNLKGGEGVLRYYEGIQAIKSVYEDVLRDVRPHDDYLIMSDLRQWLALDADYFLDFVERRAKLPLKIRMLAQDSPVARDHQRLQKTFHETIRLLPAGTKLATNLIVIPRRVVIHQLVPPVFALVIEHASVVQMHREQFEIMWKAVENGS